MSDAHTATTVLHDKETIRAELEVTRSVYHSLLDSISDGDMHHQSHLSQWTIKDLLVYCLLSLTYLPAEVEALRSGKPKLNVPPAMAALGTDLMTRMAARKETRESLASKYDAACEAALVVLNSIGEHEWELGTYFFGEGFSTLDTFFHSHYQHFNDYADHIRAALPA